MKPLTISSEKSYEVIFTGDAFKEASRLAGDKKVVIVAPKSPATTVYVGDVYVPVDATKHAASVNVPLLLVLYTFPASSKPLQALKSST